MSLTNDIYRACTVSETIFNVASCIPLIGSYSGGVRMKVGKAQVNMGFIACAAGIIFSFVFDGNDKKWKNSAHLGGRFILHGALNVFRGYGEKHWGSTIVGSPLLIVPNILTSFGPFVSYPRYR